MITPLPGATDLKPGSATKPMFGVKPALVDERGAISWRARPAARWSSPTAGPGQMRTVWGDHERFFQTYFTTYPGHYFTGDGCRRDEDGYYWITGRIDDVINVSGHRLGTAEIESALVAHQEVAEAAVVGMPHDIKGQGIYAYVTVNAGCAADEALRSGAGPMGANGNRPDRHARRHPVRARAAQDPVGQDHAPNPAQDRGGRRRRTSATRRPWPIRRWSISWWRTGARSRPTSGPGNGSRL